MIDWVKSIDDWTWVKFAGLMTFAVGVGLLKRRMFEDKLRELEEERQRDKNARFIDPFGN